MSFCTFYSAPSQSRFPLCLIVETDVIKTENTMTTEENIKKLNRQINEIIEELKKDCLEITVKQHFSNKIELAVFKRII